jgi:hypothetical protein
MPYTNKEVLLDAVEVDSTSEIYYVGDRKKKAIELSLADADADGNVACSVLVSNDGTNFVTYNRINSNIIDANTENDTRVDSVSVNAATPNDQILFNDDHFGYLQLSSTDTGPIELYSVSNAGAGYSPADEVTVTGGNSDAIIVIDTVSVLGAVLTSHIKTKGTGYVEATGVTTTGGGGTNFVIIIEQVASGKLTAILSTVIED